tara:strand:+ start:48931 stop:50412 length:1482 start_codon:yes stop_codon:yes gene_type:complete
MGQSKIFVVDTNVIMHDPTSIWRFDEHDIFISMAVLEELDKHKKGLSEVSRNVRQFSRFLDGVIKNNENKSIKEGLKLNDFRFDIGNGFLNINKNKKDNNVRQSLESAKILGTVFLQTEEIPYNLPASLPGNSMDNIILNSAYFLQNQHPEKDVILVSKDINLRIKASIIGIKAEDYSSDKVLEDSDLLYTGVCKLDENFWDNHSKDMESWVEEGLAYYKVKGPDIAGWKINQFVYDKERNIAWVVKQIDPINQEAIVTGIKDYTSPKNSIAGVSARNGKQNFVLNLLLDPDIDFVTILGSAGTGKTLLTLAAGLHQVLESNLYSEIIVTRATVPVGDDIGFLPGTEEEKMAPWMGALTDNLEVILQSEGNRFSGNSKGGNVQDLAQNLLNKSIKIRSMNFMRGRTFLNKYLILDEAQNLSPKQMKTLITRAGNNTKIVCLGNLNQIDTPYLTETNSGLSYAVDHFSDWEHSGHVTLTRGERSRLADYGSKIL